MLSLQKFSLQIGESIGESFNDVVDSFESEIDSRGRFANNDLEKGLEGSVFLESDEEEHDTDDMDLV